MEQKARNAQERRFCSQLQLKRNLNLTYNLQMFVRSATYNDCCTRDKNKRTPQPAAFTACVHRNVQISSQFPSNDRKIKRFYEVKFDLPQVRTSNAKFSAIPTTSLLKHPYFSSSTDIYYTLTRSDPSFVTSIFHVRRPYG